MTKIEGMLRVITSHLDTPLRKRVVKCEESALDTTIPADSSKFHPLMRFKTPGHLMLCEICNDLAFSAILQRL